MILVETNNNENETLIPFEENSRCQNLVLARLGGAHL